MKNKKFPAHVVFDCSIYDPLVTNSVSAYECTGLIPWGPNTRDQLFAYDEIINYSPISANVYNYTKKHTDKS